MTASILVDRLGPTGALLAAGGLEVVLVVISWPWVRRVDDAAVVLASASSASCAAWPSSGRSS